MVAILKRFIRLIETFYIYMFRTQSSSINNINVNTKPYPKNSLYKKKKHLQEDGKPNKYIATLYRKFVPLFDAGNHTT